MVALMTDEQMTPEFAISILECMEADMILGCDGLKQSNPMVGVLTQRMEAIRSAKNALRKTIRQAPEIEEYMYGVDIYCPSCHKHLTYWYPHDIDCCHYCGQAIEWPKE